MAGVMTPSFERAVRNTIAYGDTDIFPYPIENTVFNHAKDETVQLLHEIHGNFDVYISKYPPENEMSLAPVGYTGFRWATQIEPFWNLYFLSLVIALGRKIEKARIEISRNTIFSYRFLAKNSADNLFKENIGWYQFMQHSHELAKSYKYVLVCDVADFYQRINHHSLENALKQCAKDSDLIPGVMTFLSNFSNTKSYSLPVGGPAARLLAELVLNKTDRLLNSAGVRFCRFADDYHIFSQDKNSLYKTLVFLSEKLVVNEGLAIQKAKTRILSSTEFRATSPIRPEGEGTDDEIFQNDASRLLRMTLRFDPYSPTAKEDYDELKRSLEQYDIVGLLQAELQKSRIHAAIVRKLLSPA